MNMFDEAAALEGTIKMRGISQSEMAKMLGVSQSYIANKIRLLSFDSESRERIYSAGLSERHARALLRLRSDEERRKALDTVIERKLSVHQTEALVDFMYEPMAPRAEKMGSLSAKTQDFKKALAESVRQLRGLGTNITMSQSYLGSKLYITVTLDEGLGDI
jgi:ParB family chromosome partitioning protein